MSAFGFKPFLSLPLALVWGSQLLFSDCQFRAALGWHGEVKPGLRYKDTPRNRQIVKFGLPKAPYYQPTPWLWSGDLRTLYPFFAFSAKKVSYNRRWLSVPADRGLPDEPQSSSASDLSEAIALDFAYPPNGYDPSKPVLLVLHGLNGGSSELYVLAGVHQALERGWTACVVVSRGLMKTPVGEAIFHGARISDCAAACKLLKSVFPDSPLVGLGYSMGGIILSNYISRSGPSCLLSAGTCVSGCIDVFRNTTFDHSTFQWQPLLAHELKINLVVPHADKIKKKGVPLHSVTKASSVADLDTCLMVPYYGFRDLKHYYDSMSPGANGLLQNVSVPTLILNALDDPLVSPDTFLPHLGIVDTNEHLFFLLTASGGHVGWPQGLLPGRHGWNWMSNTSLDFLQSAVTTAARDRL